MKLALILAIAGAAAGAFIGAPMGIVGRGIGIGGLLVFGAMGFLIGGLAGLAFRKR